MLGLSKFKLIGGGALIFFIMTIVGAGYLHYNGLVRDNAQLRVNQERLLRAVEDQRAVAEAAQEAITEWKLAAERHRATVDAYQAVQDRAAADSRRLQRTFRDHDVEHLAATRPGLVQGAVNRGTRNAARLLECLTRAGPDCPGSD